MSFPVVTYRAKGLIVFEAVVATSSSIIVASGIVVFIIAERICSIFAIGWSGSGPGASCRNGDLGHAPFTFVVVDDLPELSQEIVG